MIHRSSNVCVMSKNTTGSRTFSVIFICSVNELNATSYKDNATKSKAQKALESIDMPLI